MAIKNFCEGKSDTFFFKMYIVYGALNKCYTLRSKLPGTGGQISIDFTFIKQEKTLPFIQRKKLAPFLKNIRKI